MRGAPGNNNDIHTFYARPRGFQQRMCGGLGSLFGIRTIVSFQRTSACIKVYIRALARSPHSPAAIRRSAASTATLAAAAAAAAAAPCYPPPPFASSSFSYSSSSPLLLHLRNSSTPPRRARFFALIRGSRTGPRVSSLVRLSHSRFFLSFLPSYFIFINFLFFVFPCSSEHRSLYAWT